MALVTYEPFAANAGLITFNDPENLNAMSEAMAAEFAQVVDTIGARSDKPRVLVLTGAGRAFSAGGDLAMLDQKRSLPPEENKRRMLAFYQAFLGIRSLNIPLVAMINGHAIGASLCLACACEFRIASQQAKLGFTFTRLGLHPGMGATYFVPRLVGPSNAADLLLSGRVIEAPEAARLGLVSRVVESAALRSEVIKLVQELLESGPQVGRMLLETLRGSPAELGACLEREASCQAINYAGTEFAEGIKAAIEKRKPRFP